MDLVINNKSIDAPIDVILNTLKKEINTGKLRDIESEVKGNIAVTCPIHKGGHERNPSCQVFTKRDDDNIEYGKCHCFSCGWTGRLSDLVTACFNESDATFGKEWLIERFGVPYSENTRFLPEIKLNNNVKKVEVIDESILAKYNFYHDYMWERKLTKEVVDAFKVGYDPKTQMLTFPIWDEYNRLVLITYRSVKDKRFFIEEDKDKPVYLLNFIKQWGIKTVYVCESQINALTLWSWGYPAIALIGTGSYEQLKILNKCPIRNYILCFDGDEAGDKGANRFIRGIRKDVLVSRKIVPRGKDVNDLSKEEFDNLNVI